MQESIRPSTFVGEYRYIQRLTTNISNTLKGRSLTRNHGENAAALKKLFEWGVNAFWRDPDLDESDITSFKKDIQRIAYTICPHLSRCNPQPMEETFYLLQESARTYGCLFGIRRPKPMEHGVHQTYLGSRNILERSYMTDMYKPSVADMRAAANEVQVGAMMAVQFLGDHETHTKPDTADSVKRKIDVVDSHVDKVMKWAFETGSVLAAHKTLVLFGETALSLGYLQQQSEEGPSLRVRAFLLGQTSRALVHYHDRLKQGVTL